MFLTCPFPSNLADNIESDSRKLLLHGYQCDTVCQGSEFLHHPVCTLIERWDEGLQVTVWKMEKGRETHSYTYFHTLTGEGVSLSCFIPAGKESDYLLLKDGS